MQALVRMYNRRTPLVYMQDVEFAVYGHLFQAGRNGWGTAGMGGNGQFNRLSALDDGRQRGGSVARQAHRGPGSRAAADRRKGGRAGRTCAPSSPSRVSRSSARCFRQRTRWSQGNLQAIGLWREVLGRQDPRPRPADRAGGLPLHALLAGDHRPRPGRRDPPARSSASPRSGAAARPTSCSSSTSSPSAAPPSARSPPGPAKARPAGSSASSSARSTRSTPGSSGRCWSARCPPAERPRQLGEDRPRVARLGARNLLTVGLSSGEWRAALLHDLEGASRGSTSADRGSRRTSGGRRCREMYQLEPLSATISPYCFIAVAITCAGPRECPRRRSPIRAAGAAHRRRRWRWRCRRRSGRRGGPRRPGCESTVTRIA